MCIIYAHWPRRCELGAKDGILALVVPSLSLCSFPVCACVAVRLRLAGVQDGVLPTADAGQQRNWSVQEENDWLRAVSFLLFSCICKLSRQVSGQVCKWLRFSCKLWAPFGRRQLCVVYPRQSCCKEEARTDVCLHVATAGSTPG